MSKSSTVTKSAPAKPATAPVAAQATAPAKPASTAPAVAPLASVTSKRWVAAHYVAPGLVVASVRPNPKRGDSRLRYEGYKVGETVAWHLAQAKGKPSAFPHMGDFKWDINPNRKGGASIVLVTPDQWAAQNNKPAATGLNLNAK